MAIGDDFAVDISGNITHVSGTGTYTVLELHRWLQDLADDAASSGNDLIDITVDTPSERSTDQIITLNAPFNIDDAAVEFIYDGSITQAGGDTVYSGLVVVGSLFGPTTLQVVQNNALYDTDTPFWGEGQNSDEANNILMRCLIKSRFEGVDIDAQKIRVYAREWNETFAEFEVTLGLGNSTAAIFTSNDLNNQKTEGTISGYTDIVNSGGTAADPTGGYQLIDLNNGNGTQPYYSQWDRGSRTINDLYERAKLLTRRGTSSTVDSFDGELFRGITTEWAYQNESGAGFNEREILAWGTSFAYDGETGSFSVGEKLTFQTSGAVGVLLYLDDQGATGTVVVAVESGTVVTGETFLGGTSGANADTTGTIEDPAATGGRGLLLALDDQGTTGTMWIQLISGSNPVNTLPIYGLTTDTSCEVNGTVTSRTPVSPVFIGQSTGSAIIGAFGIGIQAADLTENDLLFDLLNAQQAPPNNVTFTLSGLVASQDRVLVTEDNGGSGINTAQMTLAVTLNGGAETAIDVGNGNIPVDTPSTGVVRVVLDDGRHKRVPYTSLATGTFQIASTDFTDPEDATAANDVYLGYIDVLATGTFASFTLVYNADRTLFIRVRDGGGTPIKTYETTSVMGSGGGSATATRTPDA